MKLKLFAAALLALPMLAGAQDAKDAPKPAAKPAAKAPAKSASKEPVATVNGVAEIGRAHV